MRAVPLCRWRVARGTSLQVIVVHGQCGLRARDVVIIRLPLDPCLQIGWQSGVHRGAVAVAALWAPSPPRTMAHAWGVSSNEGVQGFAIPEGWNFCNGPIETPNMPGMLVDEISKNAGVNDVVVVDEVVLVFNEWEVHVRHPVNEHERDPETCAHKDHQPDQE